MTGKADLTNGGINEIFSSFFDLGYTQCHAELQYLTRTPRPLRTFNEIFKPFPINVWLSFGFTLLSLGFLMYLAHKMYHLNALINFKLCRRERSLLNFLIFPFAKITEPEPLPWFNKLSAGKLLVILWTITSIVFVMFYTSNLRAHLVTIEYETPPNTLEEIASSGRKIYIPTSAWRQR